MNRSPHFSVRGFTTFVCLALIATAATAQDASPLAGVWTLNRASSDIPREIGFNVNWMPPSERGTDAGSGGTSRGRRGSGSGGGAGRGGARPFAAPRESFDDSRRVQFVTAEARNPPARLMIVDTPASITITNALGQSRVLRPTGADEWIEIEGISIRVTTHRDAERLVVIYHVETDRDVRYTYSPSSDHQQLTVDIAFLEHGAGDEAKLVYQSGVDTPTSAAPSTSAPPTSSSPATPPTNRSATPPSFDNRPGAELRGLKTLGILVEDLSSQAVGCGLNHDAIENALTARLSAGGFTVRKNSDDDTYLYVNVMTTTMTNGTCVSRYDAFLYTHATANVSYRDQPVLAQVSLIHRGGIATTAPVSHAATVTRGLENYVDLFAAQVRDANK